MLLLPPRCPGLRRHFIAWIGSLPATKDNFKRLLRKGSVAVVAGGIAEVSLLPEGTTAVLLGPSLRVCQAVTFSTAAMCAA